MLGLRDLVVRVLAAVARRLLPTRAKAETRTAVPLSWPARKRSRLPLVRNHDGPEIGSGWAAGVSPFPAIVRCGSSG